MSLSKPVMNLLASYLQNLYLHPIKTKAITRWVSTGFVVMTCCFQFISKVQSALRIIKSNPHYYYVKSHCMVHTPLEVLRLWAESLHTAVMEVEACCSRCSSLISGWFPQFDRDWEWLGISSITYCPIQWWFLWDLSFRMIILFPVDVCFTHYVCKLVAPLKYVVINFLQWRLNKKT